MQLYGDIADDYRDFAGYAHGESPCFEAWALGVADDDEVQAWLTELPPVKRQPNLVFAAARWHGVKAPGPYADLRAALLGDDGAIRDTILSRSTQTNEVGRLATLMPALGLLGSLLEGPLSLLEVGASAGLCLYPDRYDYRWTGGALVGSGGPTLRCATVGDLPVPSRHPEVAWRGGIDLNPLDVADEAQMAWLTNLVWPEQDDRRARLRSAIAVARADPPFLVRGDLVERLPVVLEEAQAAWLTGGVPQRRDRLPPTGRPAAIPRADARPGRGRAPATGSPTRASECCPRSPPPVRLPPRTTRPSCWRSTAGPWPGPTVTARR